MADDIATLGLRVESQGVDQANKGLNDLQGNAGKAQKATDALAGSSDKASAMLLKHVQAIQAQVGELVKLQQAQLQATQAAQAGAQAQTAAAAATQALSTANIRITATYTPLKQGISATAAASGQLAQTQAQAVSGSAAVVASVERQASAYRDMAEAIEQQQTALRAQVGVGASSGAAAQGGAAQANATALMNLGKQTAAEAEETRKAAIAHSNVTAVLGLQGGALKQSKTDHEALAGAMGLTAFQGRMVALQIPDIVQGLLSGQGVFRTTIQQGGQIVQILGMGPNGFGGALSAVLRFLPGLLGFGAIAAIFGTLATAVLRGRQEFAALNNALAVTNGYSGVTANNFESMARRIAAATDTTVGATKSMVMALVEQGQLSGQALQEAATYSQKFAELSGQDASKVVASFASMRDGVTAFAIKHVQSYHDLTQAQVDEIAKLEEEGKWHEAQLLFFRDANSAIQKHVVQYGYIETALHKVGEAASSMWDKLLGLGKPKTLDDQINDLKGVLDKNAEGLRLRSMGFGVSPGMSQGAIADTVDQMARLSFQKDQEHVKTLGPLGDIGDPLAAQSQTSAQQAAVLQALAARAQAEAGLTADVVKQADLQKQALRYQTAADQARLQQQIIDLNLDKSLNDAQRGAIAGAMRRAAGINAQANADRAKQIDLQTQDKLQQQAADLAIAQNSAATSILDAQQALVTDISERAKIETTLLNLADQSAIAEQQKVIASAKLGQATEAQAKAAQVQIDAINSAHGYKQQLIDQQKVVDLIHQQAGVQQDALQNQAEILSSQKDTLEYGFQRDTLDKQILAVEQQIATSKAQEALAAVEATHNQVAIAQARADLAALEKVQANQTKAAQDTFLQSYNKITGSLDSMSSAFNKGDYVNASANLLNAMGTAANALGMQGFAGMIGQLSSVVPEIAAAMQLSQALGNALTSAFGGDKKVANETSPFAGGLGGFLIAKFNLFGLSTAHDDAAKAAAKQQLADLATTTAAAYAILQQSTQNYSSAILEFYSASGQAQKGLEEQRRQELQGLDDATAAIKKQTYAWQDYNTAISAANDNVSTAASALSDIANAAKSASDNLADLLQSLLTGDAAMNDPARQFALTKSQLAGINSRVTTGDTSALGDVQGGVQAFLDAAKAFAPDKASYDRDLAFARQSATAAKAQADSQVSIAQQQLDVANAQVGGLQTVNQSVLTVAQAVANLQAALTAQAGVAATAPTTTPAASNPGGGSYTSTHGDYAAYVQQSPDLLASYNSVKDNPVWQQTIQAAGLQPTVAGFGQFQWEHSGMLENRPVRPFAKGAAFTNGVVSSPTLFDMGLMGEAGSEAIMPLHRGPDGSLGVRAMNDNGGWGAVVDRLESIEAELRGFRTEAKVGQGFLKNIRDLFLRVSRDGDSIQTELKVPA
jgi:phage-related minor tail protein